MAKKDVTKEREELDRELDAKISTVADADLKRRKEVAKAEAKKQKEIRGFLDTAMDRLDKCIKHEDHNRKASIEDLKFSIGIDQWNGKIKQDRINDGRPCLQFDLLTENINQVVGDQRHNKVKCKVRPVDSDADPEIARIRQGIISNIEYLSNAERIYDYSMEMMCRGAYAAWEIKVRYTEENPFLQEIYMQRIDNPHTVYLGPGSDECHADAPWGFKLDKMGTDDFKATYPGAELPGDSLKTGVGLGYQHWWDGERVTVADYYVIKHIKKTMALLSDGRVMSKEDAEQEVKDAKALSKAATVIEAKMPVPGAMTGGGPLLSGGMPAPGGGMPLPGAAPATGGMPMPGVPSIPGGSPMPPEGGGAPVDNASPLAVDETTSGIKPRVGSPAMPEKEEEEELRIVKTSDNLIPKLKHYTITAMEILSEGGLEGEDMPGSFIPLILAQGPEINIEGKPYVRSFIRPAKDPQINYNYWVSAAAESVALAPKAEWIGTAKQFAGYENDFAASNMKNMPFLKYNVDEEFAPFFPPPPQRVAVKDPPIGIFTEMANSKTAVKDALGMHARDVGDVGPERSGAAITASQKPADIGSFSFIDNLKRAIEHSCRVMNSMIPDVYDSERDARIRDDTDNITSVPINTTLSDAIKRVRSNPEKYVGMDLRKMQESLKKVGKGARFNDITVGKYDVISTTGPSYATQRAESAEQMLRLATVDKRIMAVGGDLVVRSMDFQHADELADRIEKTLPRGMVPPREGKPPIQPIPPPPQAMLVMQKAKTESLKQQRETLRMKVELVKLMKETKETDTSIRKQIIKVLDELTNPEPIPGEAGWDPSGRGANKVGSGEGVD